MNHAAENYSRPGHESPPPIDFPFAPSDWSPESAESTAASEGLELSEIHWRVVRALQEFYAQHETPTINVREVHDALDEHFHAEGGIKYLYTIFPKGPLAQGCLLAGLQAPGGGQDKGFGSAV